MLACQVAVRELCSQGDVPASALAVLHVLVAVSAAIVASAQRTVEAENTIGTPQLLQPNRVSQAALGMPCLHVMCEGSLLPLALGVACSASG